MRICVVQRDLQEKDFHGPNGPNPTRVRRTRKCAPTWALGLCETAAPPDRAAGARTRQPENSKRAHFRVPALQTPPKFHEKTPRETQKERNGGGTGKKKREILGPLRGPTFSRIRGPTKSVWPKSATPILAKVDQLRLAKVGQLRLAKVGLAKVGQIRMAKVGLAKVGLNRRVKGREGGVCDTKRRNGWRINPCLVF